MSSRAIGLCLVLVVFGSVVVGVGGATPQRNTVTGAAVPLPADVEADFQQIIRDAAERHGYEPRGQVFVMYEDGEAYIVSTSQEPAAGVAEVRGSVIRPWEMGNRDVGVIFADSVSVSQSGVTVELPDLRANTERYAGRVVEVPAYYSELTYLTDVGSIQTRHRIGELSATDRRVSLMMEPGQTARWGAVNMSQFDGSSSEKLFWAASETFYTGNGEGNITAGYRSTSWWVDAPATVSVLVLPKGFSVGPGGVRLYPVSVDVREQRTLSPAELQSNGDTLVGEVVTVRGQAVGSRLSTQETLLAAAKCAPDSITVPAVGCIPIPTDVAIHTGVVASAGSPSSAVPYAGLSNQHQEVPATAERGEYRLTGRVVATDQLDPRLPDGYGLVVYERERVGSLSGGDRGQLEDAASDVADTFRSQLTMGHGEYEQQYGDRHGRPPTDTPTATANPTGDSRGGGDSGGSGRADRQNTPIVKTDAQRASLASGGGGFVLPDLSGVGLGMIGLGLFLTVSAVFTEAIIGIKRHSGRKINQRHLRQNAWVAVAGVVLIVVGPTLAFESGYIATLAASTLVGWVAGWRYVIDLF